MKKVFIGRLSQFDARPPMGPLVATPLALTYGGGTGQRRLYPIGDRAAHRLRSSHQTPREKCYLSPRSVTHVLNLKCYLCIDRTAVSPNRKSQM